MRLRFALLLTCLISTAGPATAQQGAVEAPPEDVPGVAPPARTRCDSIVRTNSSSVTCVGEAKLTGTFTCTG